MIEFIVSPAGRRAAIVCDACSRPVARAADAVVVPWASATVLVTHRGRCLDALRAQYPSTTGGPVIELSAVLEDLDAIREPAAEAAADC